MSSLVLREEDALWFRTGGKINLEALISVSKKLGTPLKYAGKDYYSFDSIFLENEIHFDGISANGKHNIPNWIVFFIEKVSQDSGGEFKVINCKTVLEDISPEIINILNKRPLEFYGFKSHFNPNPKPNEFCFSIKSIIKEKEDCVLRMHVPTSDPDYVHVEKDFIYCLIDDFRMRFKGLTGPDSLEVFDHIRDACFLEKNCSLLTFEDGDILFMNNRTSFHGRNKTAAPSQRKLHRIQIMEVEP